MNNLLKLDRPIVFFDIESTGVLPHRDRIVEIAFIKMLPDGSSTTLVRRLNPTIPIPPGATAVHKISDEDVADCPTFVDIAPSLYQYLDNCDLAGYNLLSFDVPLLVNEFKRAGITYDIEKIKIVDVFQIFCKLFPRNLTFAYKFFCGKELEGAHGAAADTQATMEVLFSQLEKYEEVPKELTELAEYSNPEGADKLDRARRFRWLNDEVIISFGKHHGTTLKEVALTQPSFLTWMLNSDFDEDTKKIAYDALHGKFPERKNPTAGSAK